MVEQGLGKMDVAVGVDVGGSFVKVGLVGKNGRLLARHVFPTEKEKGFSHLITVLEDAIVKLLKENSVSGQHVRGVGLGLPAFLDARGYLHEAVNLGWRQVPVLELLASRFPWPVQVDNDANLAALAEAWQGNGRGKNPLLCLTIGTGVGGGVVVGGRLFHGSSYMAGEIGHLPVSKRLWPCRCGRCGCLETVGSATGMIRLANDALDKGVRSLLAEEPVTVEAIFRLARQGDKLAQAVVDEAGTALSEALAMVSVVINPERVLLGGGVMHVAHQWPKHIQAKLHNRGLPRAVAHVDVLPAKFLNDAGMIGAAALFFQTEED